MTTELSGKCGNGALDLRYSSKTDKPEAISERSRSRLTLKREKRRDEGWVQIHSYIATPFFPLRRTEASAHCYIKLCNKWAVLLWTGWPQQAGGTAWRGTSTCGSNKMAPSLPETCGRQSIPAKLIKAENTHPTNTVALSCMGWRDMCLYFPTKTIVASRGSAEESVLHGKELSGSLWQILLLTGG